MFISLVSIIGMNPHIIATLGVILAFSAVVLGHRLHVPPTPTPVTTSKTVTAAAAAATRTTTPNIYYDDDNLVLEEVLRPITDHPDVSANHAPTQVNISIIGYVCTIQSVAFPGEYLQMSSGNIHYYPVLRSGDPAPNGKDSEGEWDWKAIWIISQLDVGRDEKYNIFLNHATASYLTYNATRYSFVRGTDKDFLLDNLWKVNTSFTKEGTITTIQHSQHPNGFLHALTETKKKTRAVGLLTHEPDKDIYQWRIVCDQSQNGTAFVRQG